MPRQIEAERATVPSAGGSGLASAECTARARRSQGKQNALKHGDFTAEALALKREISALARMARETMEAIE